MKNSFKRHPAAAKVVIYDCRPASAARVREMARPHGLEGKRKDEGKKKDREGGWRNSTAPVAATSGKKKLSVPLASFQSIKGGSDLPQLCFFIFDESRRN